MSNEEQFKFNRPEENLTTLVMKAYETKFYTGNSVGNDCRFILINSNNFK